MNDITGAREFYIPRSVDYCASKDMFRGLPDHYYRIIAKLRADNWCFYAVDQKRGYCSYKGKLITIPVWALIKSEEYKIWYIGHELAHAVAGSKAKHGPLFMAELRRIVPQNAIHFELGYKPMHAKNAGIYDVRDI